MNVSMILAVIHSTRADREVRHRMKGIECMVWHVLVYYTHQGPESS
jgi:hypothetical protein